MATHSSVLAWRIPRTGEPGGLPSMGSHRVRHDWSDLAAAAAARREPGPFEALPSGAESPGKSEHGRNRLPSETPVSEKEIIRLGLCTITRLLEPYNGRPSWVTLGKSIYLSESVMEGWKWPHFLHCPCPWEVHRSLERLVPQTNHFLRWVQFPQICTKHTISPGCKSFWVCQGGLPRGGDRLEGFFNSSCGHNGWSLKAEETVCVQKHVVRTPCHVSRLAYQVQGLKPRATAQISEGRRRLVRFEMKSITLVHQVQHQNNQVDSKWNIPLWNLLWNLYTWLIFNTPYISLKFSFELYCSYSLSLVVLKELQVTKS